MGQLADTLVDSGVVPRNVVDAIVAQAAVLGPDRVEEQLVALAEEHEPALGEWLAERCGAPAIVFSQSTLDLRALPLLARHVVEQHRVLPVLADASTLTVAAARCDLSIVEPLEAATGKRVVVVVAVAALLDRATKDAFAAAQAGGRVLAGSRSPQQEPGLHLARAPIRVRLPRADSVAKALGAVLDEALDGAGGVPSALHPHHSARLGALRLKQVTVAIPTVAVTQAPPPVELGPLKAYKPRVVVVEDDDSIRAMVTRVLVHDGCDVDEAADGQAAASIFRERGRPDLIVLDAMLPHVHGFELCSAIKASPAWQSVPVVMISAVFKGFESQRSIQEVHGADAFLEKPFEIQQFRLVVAELLKRAAPALPQSPAQAENTERGHALVSQYIAAGDVSGALGVVDAWLQADPFSAAAWLERGNLCLQVDDDAGALRAYELASTYGGKHFLAHLSLAMMYERLGFVRRARATWEKAALAAPDPAVAAKIREQLTVLDDAARTA